MLEPPGRGRRVARARRPFRTWPARTTATTGVRAYAARVGDAWKEFTHPGRSGSSISASACWCSRASTAAAGDSGIEVQSHPTAHLWTLRDGLVVRFQVFWDREEGLRAGERQASSGTSGPTFTSIFPRFSPLSRPMNAAGAFSMPSTTVSSSLDLALAHPARPCRAGSPAGGRSGPRR